MRSGELYWRAISPPGPQVAALEGDAACEVAIIGGGISGALVARQLLQEGLDTLLVDDGELAAESSAANTGLLLYEIDQPLCDLIPQIGEQRAVYAYRRGQQAMDELEAVVGSLPESCDFRRARCLYLASDQRGERELAREFECRRDFGFEVALLGRKELRSISSIRASCALSSHGDAQFNPYRFAALLLKQCLSTGLRGFAHTRVSRVLRHPEHFELEIPTGRIRTRHVVYTVGYAAEEFLGRRIGNLATTYVATSGPLTSMCEWPENCLIWETSRPYFYARQTEDGRAMIGGQDTPNARDYLDQALVRQQTGRLVERFHHLFPVTRFQSAYEWAGTFANTSDGLPVLGQPPGREREYFVLAYGGNGTTFSVVAGRLIVDLIVGRPNPDAAAFGFNRYGL